MLYFVESLIIIFFLTSALPLLRWYLVNQKEEEVVEYDFPTELIDYPPHEYDDESVSVADWVSLQYRGSVLLTKKGFEEKRAEVHAVQLP